MSEGYSILHTELQPPHIGSEHYTTMPSLVQPHLLPGDQLTVQHHSMRLGKRATHLLSGAWCQVELAHVRDFEGSHAEAQELIALARSQTNACHNLVQRDYKNHDEYIIRLYRSKLLHVYTDHFAQLGPTHWPDEPTTFQRTAYQRVQRELVHPLMKDFQLLCNDQSPAGEKNLAKSKVY